MGFDVRAPCLLCRHHAESTAECARGQANQLATLRLNVESAVGEQRREWFARGESEASRAAERTDPRLQNAVHVVLLRLLDVARGMAHVWHRSWVGVAVRGGRVGDGVAFYASPILQSAGRDGERRMGALWQQWGRAVARVERVVGAKRDRG